MTHYYFFRCSSFWALCITNFLLVNASYSSPSEISNTGGCFRSTQVAYHMPHEANLPETLSQHTISHQRHTKSNQTIMIIEKIDPLTGKRNAVEIDLTEDQFTRIEAGVEMIQTIVPHLTPDEREFLISGITAESWNRTFPPEREEELKAFEESLEAELPDSEK